MISYLLRPVTLFILLKLHSHCCLLSFNLFISLFLQRLPSPRFPIFLPICLTLWLTSLLLYIHYILMSSIFPSYSSFFHSIPFLSHHIYAYGFNSHLYANDLQTITNSCNRMPEYILSC